MIKLQKKEDCCGCRACVQCCPVACFVMYEDEEGFLYPKADETRCINCGLCDKVCPILNQYNSCLPNKTLAAKNPDETSRIKSSSGGIFTLLAKAVITRGGVVFGALFNEQWEVVHDYVEVIDEIVAFRGSKYVQSDIGDSFLQIETFLKQGREVLFSGTSCQVAGLKHFLRKDYSNLFTVDVVCHGVPSPKIWREYLKSLKIRKGDIGSFLTEISFRDKTDGWRNYRLVIKGEKEHELLNENYHKNTFIRGFLKNIFLRPSCYACPAKCGRSHSDITIADFWGIEKHYPEFDDDKGVSLLFINSSKGNSEYSSLETEDIEVQYAQALQRNPSIERSVALTKYRNLFWNLYQQDGIEAIDIVLKKMQSSATELFMNRIKNKIKRFILK